MEASWMLFALLQDVLPHDFFSLAAHMPPGWNESYQAGHQRTSASDYFSNSEIFTVGPSFRCQKPQRSICPGDSAKEGPWGVPENSRVFPEGFIDVPVLQAHGRSVAGGDFAPKPPQEKA